MNNDSELLLQRAHDRMQEAQGPSRRQWTSPRVISSTVEDNTENGGGASTDSVVAS